MARRSLLDIMRGRVPDGDLTDRQGRPLTASAQVIPLTDRTEGIRLAEKALRQAWQPEAWTYRRNIGEVRYVQDWLATAVSRMRLYVGVISDQADVPIELAEAVAPGPDSDLEPTPLPTGFVQACEDALSALGNLAPLLHRATVSTECVGEWYLVGYMDEAGRERWEVRNVAELVETQWGMQLRGAPTAGRSQTARPSYTWQGGTLLDPADSFFLRIWRADAEWSDLADAPMSAVRGHCELLLLLERKARGNARSRLSAPLLIIPGNDETKPVIGPDGPIVPKPIGVQVTEHVVTPIGDESAAAAVAPIVITSNAPEKWTTVDVGRHAGPEDRAEREEALHRILQGLDADTEIVEGMSGVKFANQQAITQDRFRYLIEPKVLFLIHALTVGYLHTRLASDPRGFSQELIDQVCLWYDPSELVTNPDQAKDAITVFGTGELSGKALRRYTGFSETDAPTDEERAAFLALNAKRNGQRPADDPAPVPALPDPGSDPAEEDDAASLIAATRAEVAQVRRVAALTAAATQQPSDLGSRLLRIDQALYGRLQGAADGAMARALEKAGSRARSKARAAGNTAGAGTSNDRLVSVLGQDGIRQVGLTTDDLLAGDPFEDVCSRFEQWAEAAQEQGLRAYAKALGLTYYPPRENDAQASLTAAAGLPPFSDLGGLDFPALRAQGKADRALASGKLRAELTRIAAERLYEPEFSDTAGEHDPSTIVPPGTLRAAMARAGGADSHPRSSGITDTGQPASDADPAPGGIATGWTLREASAAAGLKPYAYTWSHGASANPFEPHLALDGQTFASQADPRLAKNPAAWPKGTTSYYPGDHPGCTCWTQFDYHDPFAGMTRSEAARVRASQQARDEHGRFASRRDHPDDTPGEGTTPQRRT